MEIESFCSHEFRLILVPSHKKISLNLLFCFIQITIPVTKSFVEYLKTQPMVFEVFGHYQHLQPVGHSAALIGSLQSSMSISATTKSPPQDGSISSATKQSTLATPNQVNIYALQSTQNFNFIVICKIN